jgi:flavin-dependent dehydrogenase
MHSRSDGRLRTLEATSPLPITHSSTHIDSERRYIGKIPFYGINETLPPHGFIVPRDVFDSFLLKIAGKAGATIHEETYATGFNTTDLGVQVQAQSMGKKLTYRGLLIGDAGSFVDSMTGEGIAPATESALIAARVIFNALHSGRLDAEAFSAYEKDYRSYFDPLMIFVALCAATLRNRHYWGSWKKALVRGCAVAQKDTKLRQSAPASVDWQ